MVLLLYFAEFCIGLPFQKDCFKIENPFWMMLNCKNGFSYSMDVINPPTSIDNFPIDKSTFQSYGSIPDVLEKTTDTTILPPLRPISAIFEGRRIFIRQKTSFYLSSQSHIFWNMIAQCFRFLFDKFSLFKSYFRFRRDKKI